jgi:hypothetical protein
VRSRRRQQQTKKNGLGAGSSFAGPLNIPRVREGLVAYLTVPKAARLAGCAYVCLAISGVFTEFTKGKLILHGHATITAAKILASEGLFILNIFSELATATSWSIIAVALYVLFRKVNHGVAVLMLSLVLVGSAVIVINVAFQIAALLVLRGHNAAAGGNLASSFSAAQRSTLAMLFLDVAHWTVIADFVFMGLWMFPFAYFVLQSRYFPRTASMFWSGLLIIGGVGYLVDLVTFMLWPDAYRNVVSFTFWGDVFSIFWLLLGRVNPTR